MIKKFVIIVTNKAPVGEKFWGEERNMEGDSPVPQKRLILSISFSQNIEKED